MPARKVRPGDWFVTDPGGRGWVAIELGERIAERLEHPKVTTPEDIRWGHAGVAVKWDGGKLYTMEAGPQGARLREWGWEHRPHMWSTGTGLSEPGMAATAMSLEGTPYSYLDYWAIAAHAAHLPMPGLRAYIAAAGHLMCSALTDRAALLDGVHLFDDGRWEGYVTPLDLALLLISHGVRPVFP